MSDDDDYDDYDDKDNDNDNLNDNGDTLRREGIEGGPQLTTSSNTGSSVYDGDGYKQSQTQPIDLIGDATFFNFLCAVFSRIAYVEDPLTLFLCSDVINNIFTKKILEKFCVDNTADLNDDDKLFQLSDKNPLELPTRTYNGKLYVDFIDYAKKVNSLIENTKTSPYYTGTTDIDLSIVSIADSNYGDTLIIRMSFLNIVFTVFRGTYSAKTAQSYSQVSTLVPKIIDDDGDKGLGGIAKIELETAKTTLNAMLWEANLYKNIEKKIIIAITGHSLGGAMATIKTFEFLKNNKNDLGSTDKENRFFNINPIPICVSFGAPRVLGKNSNEKLCGWITNKELFFTRCSNRGDPVTSVPSSKLGYYHPCSDTTDTIQVTTKKNVLEECNSPVSVIQGASKLANGEVPVTVVYTKKMNCSNVLPSTGLKSIISGTSVPDHIVYYYVSFAKATDVKSFASSTLSSKEIARIAKTTTFSDNITIKYGDTKLRLIFMQGDKTKDNEGFGMYSDVFLDLKNIEKALINTKTSLTSAYSRDDIDTSVVFKMLTENATKTVLEMEPNTKPNIPMPFKKISNNVIDSNNAYDKLISSIINPSNTTTSSNKSSWFSRRGGKKTKKRSKKTKKRSKKTKKRRISKKHKNKKSKSYKR